MTDPDRITELHARADRVRTEMGGADKVAKMSDEGDRTIREPVSYTHLTLPTNREV